MTSKGFFLGPSPAPPGPPAPSSRLRLAEGTVSGRADRECLVSGIRSPDRP